MGAAFWTGTIRATSVQGSTTRRRRFVGHSQSPYEAPGWPLVSFHCAAGTISVRTTTMSENLMYHSDNGDEVFTCGSQMAG